MKDWIMELCPEITEWQAELIEQNVMNMVLHEREACALIGDSMDACQDGAIGRAIRARGNP